jgi:hypothetical protein
MYYMLIELPNTPQPPQGGTDYGSREYGLWVKGYGLWVKGYKIGGIGQKKKCPRSGGTSRSKTQNNSDN